MHRNLACVIDKSSRGAKLKRAFEELPKATKKVKSLVASLLAAVAVAVSGAAYAGPTSMHDSGMSTEIMQVDQSSPLLA